MVRIEILLGIGWLEWELRWIPAEIGPLSRLRPRTFKPRMPLPFVHIEADRVVA